MGNVIYHTANIAPGNSGGPLLDRNGRVVGVNFAEYTDEDLAAAISWEEAQPIVEFLIEGMDLDSIGINGEAFELDDEEFFGIWVVSVEPGSPASTAGILPADILLGLEEIPVGINGDFGSYCSVLRSHSPDAVMRVMIGRLSTQELLCGEINGEPIEACDPVAEGWEPEIEDEPVAYTNGIYRPQPGTAVNGYISVQGIAVHPAFWKWQLDLLINGTRETYLAAGESPMPALGELFVLNTALYPNGDHYLRLRVVRTDGNYDEYFAGITVRN